MNVSHDASFKEIEICRDNPNLDYLIPYQSANQYTKYLSFEIPLMIFRAQTKKGYFEVLFEFAVLFGFTLSHDQGWTVCEHTS